MHSGMPASSSPSTTPSSAREYLGDFLHHEPFGHHYSSESDPEGVMRFPEVMSLAQETFGEDLENEVWNQQAICCGSACNN